MEDTQTSPRDAAWRTTSHMEYELRKLREQIAQGSPLGAGRWWSHLASSMIDLGEALAQAAHDDGATKTKIADAMGVPASTFRGMTRRT